MAISYVITDGGLVVHSTAEGDVTPADLFAHIRRMADDPQVPRPLLELWDGRGLTSFSLFGVHVRQAVTLASEFGSRFGQARVAVVSTNNAVYGLGRMAQAFMDGSEMQIRVFRKLEPARSWIGDQLTMACSG